MIKLVRLSNKEAEVLANAYKEAKNKATTRSVFIRDIENIEQGLSRTADRCDIWQDRLIYAICKAVYDLLKWATRRDEHNDKPC